MVVKNFWRFVALVVITFGTRTAYRFLDAALPKYMERTLGEGSLYGTILMLNPLSTLLFTPLVAPLVFLLSQYSNMLIGAVVATISCIFPLIESSYTMFALLSVVQGLGESIFSPRFWDYSIQLAPKGMEGTYMALAVVPQFFGSFVSGMLSGVFLDSY
jgi:MFS family permease